MSVGFSAWTQVIHCSTVFILGTSTSRIRGEESSQVSISRGTPAKAFNLEDPYTNTPDHKIVVTMTSNMAGTANAKRPVRKAATARANRGRSCLIPRLQSQLKGHQLRKAEARHEIHASTSSPKIHCTAQSAAVAT